VLEKGLRTIAPDIAMIKFVDESISVNYCFCSVLVSCALIYSLVVMKYVYMFLVNKMCSPYSPQVAIKDQVFRIYEIRYA